MSPTKEQYIARLARVPVSDDVGSLRTRRRRVVALYGGFAAMCVIYRAAYGHGPLGWRIAGLIGVALAFGCFCYGFFTLLQRTYINAPNIGDYAFDERQRVRRDQAIRRAYPVIGAISGLVPLYAVIAITADKWQVLRDGYVVQCLAWTLFILTMTLPTAIMAWTEPDPLPED
jgi:hypothetical protein